MNAFKYIAVTGALIGAAAGPAQSQGDLGGTVMAFLKGTCSSLVVGGVDRTAECKPSLINNAYRSGRSSFMFGLSDSTMVSFFGIDTKAKGDQAVLNVDEIGIATGHADGTAKRVPHAVQGTCTYTNPYAGASRISCNAQGADGRYSVEFLSDGQPPHVVKL